MFTKYHKIIKEIGETDFVEKQIVQGPYKLEVRTNSPLKSYKDSQKEKDVWMMFKSSVPNSYIGLTPKHTR
jgi:hypothetical protein